MFKIKILTIGKCKEIWLEKALSEYEKRLSTTVHFEWILAKDDKELEELCEKESFIALDPNGTHLNSEAFSQKFISFGLRQTYVIGGACGLSEKLLKKARFIWSLSSLVFTHQITRLILIEQIYRALEIEKGSKYHK